MEFQPVEVVQTEIIFKEINPEDFIPHGYTSEKVIIEPDAEGFISDQISEQLADRFDIEETVVINAGVGQGKSTVIIQLAKQYYDSGYLIIYALPYKSLVDQYQKSLVDIGISENDISDYRKIKTSDNPNGEEPNLASSRAVHLLTVNCLLGNPGEKYVGQSSYKTRYLNFIISRAIQNDLKAILIFDEIHDGLHNFKQRFIFSLWKWKEITQKIFIASATYNEASKIIIQYLAELTNDSVFILEARRVKFENQRSTLSLVVYPKDSYGLDDEGLKQLFVLVLNTIGDKKINILTFTASLAKRLTSDKNKIGELIIQKYGDSQINLCTAESGSKFINDKCNIGTNFTIGINIQGLDKVLMVVLPSEQATRDINSNQGVFTSGSNTVIQSLARMRSNSEIYVLLPRPKFFIGYTNSTGASYIENVKRLPYFNSSRVDINKFQNLNNQKQLISNVYNILKRDVQNQINIVNTLRDNRTTNSRPSLEFPTLEDFVLTDGEKYLVNKYEIFGKDLSIYMFWAAFNDQFLNCKLKSVLVQESLYLEEHHLMEGLKQFIFNAFFEFNINYVYHPIFEGMFNNTLLNETSDLAFYSQIRDSIFSGQVFLNVPGLDGFSTPTEFQKCSPIYFEKQIIAITQFLKKDNWPFRNRFMSLTNLEERILIDAKYENSEYLLSCFSHALNFNDSSNSTEDERLLVNSYRTLGLFLRDDFINKFICTDDEGQQYFEPSLQNIDNFNTDEIQNLRDAVYIVTTKDAIIRHKIISFFQSRLSNDPLVFLDKVYRTFKREFFTLIPGRIHKNGICPVKSILVAANEIPDSNSVLNLIYNSR